MKTKKIIYILSILIFLINLSKSYSYTETELPEISAQSAILIDSATEKTLYTKNENKKMYPASTTKILTAIITIENCNLQDTVKVPYEAISTIPAGYSIASLQPEEQLSIEQLLQLLLIHSANDAANVLAYHISGSIENFAEQMNNKISELKLQNTHFTNPSGIHNSSHYTTAYDLAIIMKYCMKNPTFRNISAQKQCTIPPTNKYSERTFTTTNELLINKNSNTENNYYYKYAIAGKTGYTSEAQNCLVSVSNKNGLELICVVLSATTYPNDLNGRFIDTKSIFTYGYSNYTISKLQEQNSIATQIEIENATEETKNLDLLVLDDITTLISQKDLETGLTPEIQIDENLSAPILQGQKIGKIIYNIDNVQHSSDLIASHNVEEKTDTETNTTIFPIKNLTLIFQILFVILALYILYKCLFGNKEKKLNNDINEKNNLK